MHSNVVDLSHAPDSSNVITLVISVPEKTQRGFFHDAQNTKICGKNKTTFYSMKWCNATIFCWKNKYSVFANLIFGKGSNWLTTVKAIACWKKSFHLPVTVLCHKYEDCWNPWSAITSDCFSVFFWYV